MGLGRAWIYIRRWLEFQANLQLARIHWRTWNFEGSPVVFGNALPKSGSKLLRQIFMGFQNTGRFRPLYKWPIRTITYNGRNRRKMEVRSDLSKFLPGSLGLGYIPGEPEFIDILGQSNWASFVLIRDPRDLLVSHVFYASELYLGHSMASIYSRADDFNEKLMIAIQGTDGFPNLPNIAQRYEGYLPFLDREEFCLLRFEDLRNQPREQIGRMLQWIETRGQFSFGNMQQNVELVLQNIDPQKSSTFRKGAVGEWSKYFTTEHKQEFERIAPNLIETLGYSRGDAW